jgi:hypothetical protein
MKNNQRKATPPADKPKPKPTMSDLFGAAPVPERPVELSQKTKQKNSDKSVQEKKQGHDVYNAFNAALFDCIADLEKKFPQDTKKYSFIRKTINNYIKTDIAKPLEIWVESVGDNDYVLRKYTPQHEAIFLKIAPSIPILAVLEITENWQHFKPAEKKLLWKHFEAFFECSDLATYVDPDSMDSIQFVQQQLETMGLNADVLERVDPLEALKMVSAAIESNPALKNISQEIQAKYAPVIKPDPPSYGKARAKALED